MVSSLVVRALKTHYRLFVPQLYWLSPSSATLIKKDIASQPISLCSPRWPILSPSSRSSSSSAYSTEIKIQCWSCGETKPDSSILICPSCKAVQALHPSMDYFKIFDQDQLFNINLKELEGKYKNLMKKLHPDLSHGKSKEEKENSAEVSAFVTQAYNELLNPVSRAAYLLKIKGIYVDEEGTVFDPEIITEVMEIREALEGAPNRDTLEKLCDKARSKMGEWSNVFNAAYKQGDNTAAVAALQRMSYFGRVFQDIKRELL